MKYIKNYSLYKEDKINEEFIGSLIRGIKNKLSMGFSKMFGKSKEAQNTMNEYKSEIDKLNKTRLDVLKEYADYIKKNKKGNKSEIKKLNEEYNRVNNIYKQQLEILKQKFDLKLGEIIKNEKNEKIKNYINLKKLEMQQEILTNELKIILTETGLSDDELKADPALLEIINATKAKLKKSVESAKEEVETLKDKKENKEENKKDSFEITDKGGIALLKTTGWVDSPFSKGTIKLNIGDTINYYTKYDEDKKLESKLKTNIIKAVEQDVIVIPKKKKSANGDNELRINKNKILSKNINQTTT